jgi:hypothetical protein
MTARKRRTAPNATRHRRSPAAGESEQVALFKRERDEALFGITVLCHVHTETE